HAVAERQVLAHAKVVLNIPAELILSILHGRIADALRELGRQSGFECIDIRELKSAEWIRSFVAAIAAGLELPAETKTMFLECIIDIVRKLDIKLPATATPLRAAVVERARNQNRAAQTHRARVGHGPARLQTHFVEKLLAEHAGIAEARDVFSLIL